MKKTLCLAIILLVCFSCNTGETDKKIEIHESEELDLNTRKKRINDFFNGYEASFNQAMAGDTATARKVIVTSFAACFVESSPVGVICGQNNEEFFKKIGEGFNFYKSIGSRSMHILSKNIDKLDSIHASVKVKWQYKAIKRDNKEVTIEFTNYYFLNLANDSVKIFAYIAGDEQKALKENGLTP